MSTRNPLEWTEIGDIVRSAQDALCRIQLGKVWREHREYSKKALESVEYSKDMSPPQTLGELCLELHADKLRRCELDGYRYWAWYPDVDVLRGLMYRRNTDPTKVSRANKVDKITHHFWKEQQEGLKAWEEWVRPPNRGNPIITPTINPIL